MNVNVEKWENRIIDDEILAFEFKHSIQIPKLYKIFLAKNNVCVTEPDGFFTKHVKHINKEDKPDNELGVFRGFLINNEEWNLEWLYSIFVLSDRITEDYLPITMDGAGNIICLGIIENNKGKVYFWFAEEESKDPFCLADNFNDFLNSIG
jgi:hypothetical protein